MVVTKTTPERAPEPCHEYLVSTVNGRKLLKKDVPVWIKDIRFKLPPEILYSIASAYTEPFKITWT